MNSVELKNELTEEISSIKDDVCLIMLSIHYPEKEILEVAKLYDNLSNVWHTMRDIGIGLSLEIEQGFFGNPEIKGQTMSKEYLILFIEDIIKRTKSLVIKLRDITNSEPRFFDLGYTPSNIKFAYRANNAWLLLEDVKKIING